MRPPLTAILATFLGMAATPALAQPAFPPPPVESGPFGPPPGPRAAYVLEPGHYTWVGGQYVWVGRQWVARRAGWGHFVPGHWNRVGRWVPEHWRP